MVFGRFSPFRSLLSSPIPSSTSIRIRQSQSHHLFPGVLPNRYRQIPVIHGKSFSSSASGNISGIKQDPGSITIAWGSLGKKSDYQIGKSESTYHNVWLRDNCQCPKCLHPSTKQKLHSSSDIPLDVTPSSIKVNSQANTLEIKWISKSSNNNDKPHDSYYPLDWLQKNDYSLDNIKSRLRYDHPIVFWDRKMMDELSSMETRSTPVKSVWKSYNSFMDTSNQDENLYHVVSNLRKYGIAFLSGVPTDDVRAVELVAGRFGPIRETFYGRSWDVKSVVDAKNIAYTSLFLGLHMDLMYFESPPGLQFLHCIDCSVSGGESIFLDSYKASDILRRYNPQDFEILCKVPVTFHYENNGHHMRFRRPTVSVNDVNHDIQVYYAPPFMGPLEAEPDMVEKFYAAFKALDKIMMDDGLIFQYKLRPGDCVIFANRRVLHGRQAFEAGNGKRHLRGTYVDWDVIMDRYRTLKKVFGPI